VDSRFRKIFKVTATVLFAALAVLYPVFVYYSLVIRKIPLRQFSLAVIIFAFLIFITGTSRGKSFKYNALILLGLGALCLLLNTSIILKFYPLIMNLVFLVNFGITLFSPPCMVFRFATMQDKSIKGSPTEKQVETYCRKVTIVWCVFFILNGSAAAWTIFFGTDAQWSIYNGGISYILTGIIFAGEFIIRMIVQKKMNKSVPPSVNGFNSLNNTEKIIDKTENKVSMILELNESNPYFSGHFPGFPILPAVAQLEMAVRFSSRIFGTGTAISQIKRMKFINPVHPPLAILLIIEVKNDTLSFNISSSDGELNYSLGTVILYPPSEIA